MELVTAALVVLLVSCLLYASSRRPPSFPPGLARLPLIGQGFKGSKPVQHLWRSHRLMGHFIGNTPAVTIQDFKLARHTTVGSVWRGHGHSSGFRV